MTLFIVWAEQQPTPQEIPDDRRLVAPNRQSVVVAYATKLRPIVPSNAARKTPLCLTDDGYGGESAPPPSSTARIAASTDPFNACLLTQPLAPASNARSA
jgi:hypothetical protein